MWAYKDVALRCIDLVEDKPTQMFATNFADFETGLRYCFKLVIIAIILNGFAALKNIYLHSYMVAQRGKAHYAKVVLKSTPTCLGIGLVWFRAGQIFTFVLPKDMVQDNITFIFEGLALLVSNIILTFLLKQVMYWYDMTVRAADDLGEETDVLKMTTEAFRNQEFKRLWVGSMPYLYSWCWANFGYFIVFRVMFSCSIKDPTCSDDTTGHKTFFIQLYYAIALTAALIKILPSLKANKELMSKLNKHCIKTFMTNDQEFFTEQRAKSSVHLIASGIIIGLAWTNVAALECAYITTTWTCPDDFTVQGELAYLAVVIIYVTIIIFFYHTMMEAHRLSNRCRKLIAIEDGHGDLIFSGIMDEADENSDGVLDKQELEEYFDSHGLNPEPFLHAAARVDERDGVITGDVDVTALMDEVDVLLETIKVGDYVPGLSKFSENQVEYEEPSRGTITAGEIDIEMVPTMGVIELNEVRGTLAPAHANGHVRDVNQLSTQREGPSGWRQRLAAKAASLSAGK